MTKSTQVKPRISRPVIAWVVLILMFAIYLRPIGLPLTVEKYTLNVYKFIEGLGPKDKPLLYSIDYSSGGMGEVYAGALAIMKHIISRGIRVVVVGLGLPESTSLMEMTFKDAEIAKKYVYGVDYVGIGYIPGFGTASSQMAVDFKSVVKTDAYGNKLDDLPLTKNVQGWRDFSGIVQPTTVPGGDWISYWRVPYGVPVCEVILASGTPGAVESMAMGYLVGFLPGTKGGAEYEKLTGFYGQGLKTIDVLSGLHILAVVLIIIGNAEYFLRRREK